MLGHCVAVLPLDAILSIFSPFAPPQVNTAARMETTSEPGCVQLSPSSADLLRRGLPTDLVLTPRGEIAVKGKVRAAAPPS